QQPAPICPRFPYTTLFRSTNMLYEPASEENRSRKARAENENATRQQKTTSSASLTSVWHPRARQSARRLETSRPRSEASSGGRRSEEHTSELQSRFDLVCR